MANVEASATSNLHPTLVDLRERKNPQKEELLKRQRENYQQKNDAIPNTTVEHHQLPGNINM